MTRIILARHGETELNVLQKTPLRRFNGRFDTPLTSKGKEQAVALGKFLAARTDIKLQAAVTSTVSRTIDMARIVLAQLPYSVPVLDPNPLWNERSLGIFENLLATDVFREFPQYRDHPDFREFTMHYQQKAPDGENFTEVTDRAWLGVEEVEQDFDGDVAVFTHGHLMRCVLGKMFQLSHTQSIAMHIPNAHPFLITKEMDEYVLEGELRID